MIESRNWNEGTGRDNKVPLGGGVDGADNLDLGGGVVNKDGCCGGGGEGGGAKVLLGAGVRRYRPQDGRNEWIKCS